MVLIGPPSRFSLVMLGLCVGVGAVIAYELSAEPESVESGLAQVKASRPVAKPEVAPPDFSIGPLSDFSEVSDRPLFFQSRRPPKPPPRVVPVVSTTPAVPPKLELIGVINSPQNSVALMRSESTAKILHFQENQKIVDDGKNTGSGNWVLDKILKDRVVLRSSDTLHTIEMTRKSKKQTEKPQRRRYQPKSAMMPAKSRKGHRRAPILPQNRQIRKR